MNKDMMAERLKEAREKAGFDTAAAAAQAFGWGESGYRHHEGGVRSFDIANAIKYAKAFKINPGWLLGLDAIDAPAFRIPTSPATRMVEVIGAVEAGVWRERAEWPKNERYEVEFGYPIVSNAERFSLVVEGFSMDKVFPPGSLLECIRVYRGKQDPQADDLVIVQRRQHDLSETTCKRLVRGNSGWELHAESTKPEFKEPIILGNPDDAHFGDDAIEVIGIVVRAMQTHWQHRRRE